MSIKPSAAREPTACQLVLSAVRANPSMTLPLLGRGFPRDNDKWIEPYRGGEGTAQITVMYGGSVMVPQVDHKVDYAFKRLFGREPNRALSIHLLNAVLEPPSTARVVALDLLNPFNDKDHLDDKLSILDIKARDQSGWQFNVE